MKSFLLVLVFAATGAQAASVESAGQWISQFPVPEQGEYEIKGIDMETGKSCALFISERGTKQYFVVVGPANTEYSEKTKNDFFGVSTVSATFTPGDGEVSFGSNTDWGNDAKFNMIHVELHQNGSPKSATGWNHVDSLRCDFGRN